jgi:hypothetical protein
LLKRYKNHSLLHPWQGKFLLVFIFAITNIAYGQNSGQDDSLPSPFKVLYAMDLYRNNAVDSLKYLIPILDSVWESDQKYRYRRPNEPQAAATERLSRHKKEILYIDSVNVVIITGILDRYGWIDKKRIGFLESSALFFVIQHATIDTQEKYLPSLRKAVLDKIESPHHLTMLEDRVSIRKKKYQVYGTQLFFYPPDNRYYLYPMIEPENIMQRRKEVGLDSTSFSSYLKQFNLEWDLAKYRKELSKVEKYIARIKASL